jgi:hypothetical protein
MPDDPRVTVDVLRATFMDLAEMPEPIRDGFFGYLAMPKATVNGF